MSPRGMTCEEVIEQIFAYLDGDMDEASTASIRHHLEHCRDCFTRAEFEKKLRIRIAETATVKAPERLHRRVRALLDDF